MTAWNWAVVAIPLFVGVAVALVISLAAGVVDLRAARTDDDRGQARAELISKVIAFSILALLAFSFIGMLIVRLNETSPPPPLPTDAPSRSVAVILTPLYIVAGLIFCCCCCCLPCLLCLRPPNPGQAGPADEVAHIFRQRPQLYIEASRNGPQPAWTVNMA